MVHEVPEPVATGEQIMNGLFLSPHSALPPQLGSTLCSDGLELLRPTFRDRSYSVGSTVLGSTLLESLAASTLIRKASTQASMASAPISWPLPGESEGRWELRTCLENVS